MPLAARSIDPDVWTQRRYLAWAEQQPEHLHFEFDGTRPVAMAPATVGHNRVAHNIRHALRQKLPAGTPCDVYGPQAAIETVGGALREPDAFIACAKPARTDVIIPAPVIVFEVLSPGRDNRHRDEQDKVDEYESVPTILRYIVVESERRGYQVFWRIPGERTWQRIPFTADGLLDVPEFGLTLTLDEVYAGLDFSEAPAVVSPQ